MENKTIGALIILGMIAIISAATAAASFYSVGVSQVAILVNQQSGDFSGPIIGPTFGWKSPFFVNVVIISTSTQTISLVNTTKDQSQSNGIFVLSQDNLEIEFDVNFRYQINANHAIDLYKKFPGQNWENSAIIPHIRTAFRDIVSKYPAEQVASSARAAIQTGVEQEIAQNIGNDTSLSGAIQVVATQVVDITLPGSFLNAIQNKLNAQQQLAQAQFQAEQLVVTALGQKNATIIAAEAVANATLIQAQANAQSITNIISQVETATHTT